MTKPGYSDILNQYIVKSITYRVYTDHINCSAFGAYDVLTQLRKENSQMKKYEEAIIEIEKFYTESIMDESYKEDENELPGI